MAIVMYEKFGSRAGQESSGPGSRQMLEYVLFGTSDDKAVKTHVQNNAPQTYDGLRAENYIIDPIGPDLWEVVVTYVDPARKQESPLSLGSYRHEFSTSGGTQKITHGLAVRSWAPSGKTAPNYVGAINYRGGVVEGCEIFTPMIRRTIRKRVSRATITEAYIKTVEDLTDTVNSAAFKGRARGEVLFLGADGLEGTEIDPDVAYEFLISRNLTGLTYGAVTGVEKLGHEYLWVDYEYQEDSMASALVSKVRAVYTHQVYHFGDLTLLGI